MTNLDYIAWYGTLQRTQGCGTLNLKRNKQWEEWPGSIEYSPL